MAKISTRKPTTLIKVKREAHTEGVSPTPLPKSEMKVAPQSEIMFRSSASQNPAVVEEPLQQKKIVVEPPQPTSPSNTLPPVRSQRRNDGFKKAVVVGSALLLLTAAIFRGTGSNTNQHASLSGGELEQMLLEDDSAREAHSMWKNEKPSALSKPFRKLCMGYAKSDNCSDEALHPFKEVYAQYGYELRFPEERQKVIERTIEYKSKAFNFGR